MPRCIVVGTDGSETATRAVERAAELALALSSTLHLVSVYSTTPGGVAAVGEFAIHDLTDWTLQVRTEVELMLAGLGQRLATSGLEVETHALAGHPVVAMLRLAEQLDAQLVVVGNKGMRGLRRILGSVPNAVAHQAPCDVLIVHTT